MTLLVPTFAAVTAPASAAPDLWGGKQDDFEDNVGLGNTDPRDIVANVIKILMGFLGLIAVILILIAGFKWMTAQGNDKQVEEAKTLLFNAVAGLLLILAAYGIANFVIDQVMTATNS
jgi:hypothetical protein